MISPPEVGTSQPENVPASPKAVAFVGFSNSGKTELICRLLPGFAARGLRVAVLKHSHHMGLASDDAGKDAWRYRRAGAHAAALAAPGLLQVSYGFAGDPPLTQVLKTLSADVDLILVEGYKSGPLPKVAVLGAGPGEEVPDYPHLIALVGDRPVDSPLPVFQPHEVEELGHWLYDYLYRD